MNLTDNPGKINEIVKFMDYVTEGLPVRAGSVLRVPSGAYANWGIRLTPDNSVWLYKESQKAYACEQNKANPSDSITMALATRNTEFSDINTNMNTQIADMAYSMLKAKEDAGQDSFLVYDIGAGTGNTTAAFVEKIIANGSNAKITICMVEPSAKWLDDAMLSIEKIIIGANAQERITIEMACENDINGLMKAKDADIAISNAAIHHNSFNLHLKALFKSLKMGGVFINGDWHDSISEHPIRILELLKKLGTNQKLIRDFLRFFQIGEGGSQKTASGLYPQEAEANRQMINFWEVVGKKFGEENKTAHVCFLEAHERVRQRENNMRSAGFETDSEKIRMAFPKATLLRKNPVSLLKTSELATISAVARLK